MEKDKTPEEIADDLEEEVGVILPICELAREFVPEYNYAKIYEKYYVQRQDRQPDF